MHDGGFLPGLSGVMRGQITGFGPDSRAQVVIPSSSDSPQLARSLVPLTQAAIGSEVALVMMAEDEPLILGLIQPLVPVVEVDGERLVLEAAREVVLRCGKASITMTADGRITLRGTQILSRSDGPNRVQGASVQLN